MSLSSWSSSSLTDTDCKAMNMRVRNDLLCPTFAYESKAWWWAMNDDRWFSYVCFLCALYIMTAQMEIATCSHASTKHMISSPLRVVVSSIHSSFLLRAHFLRCYSLFWVRVCAQPTEYLLSMESIILYFHFSKTRKKRSVCDVHECETRSNTQSN